jgi:AcrR family transcriptional regulator
MFSEKGAEACTLRDIAKEAGVAPATLIVHFRNKTALLDATFSDELESVLSESLSSLPPGGSLLDSFVRLSGSFIRAYGSNRDLYGYLVRTAVFTPAERTPHLTRQADRYMRMLAAMIEEARDQGLIRSEINPAVAAAGLLSLYLGALAALFRMPDKTIESIIEGLRMITEHYVRGISSPA